MSSSWSFVGASEAPSPFELPTARQNPAHILRPTPSRVDPSSLSWWERKSREELNAEAERRLPDMLKSNQSRFVSGLTDEGGKRAGRPKRTAALEDT